MRGRGDVFFAQRRHTLDAMHEAFTYSHAQGIARELEGLGTVAIGVAMDLTKSEDRARLVATTVEAFGGIDVLVNNAFATGRPAPIEGTDIGRSCRRGSPRKGRATTCRCPSLRSARGARWRRRC